MTPFDNLVTPPNVTGPELYVAVGSFVSGAFFSVFLVYLGGLKLLEALVGVLKENSPRFGLLPLFLLPLDELPSGPLDFGLADPRSDFTTELINFLSTSFIRDGLYLWLAVVLISTFFVFLGCHATPKKGER